MEIRLLSEKDMPEFTSLIRQLSPQASTGTLTDRSAWFDLTKHQPKSIFVAVDSNGVVGTISVFLEEKINRGTRSNGRLFSVAHIEEMVVAAECRGKGLGKQLVDHAVKFSKQAGAYKIILDCSEENVGFYEKCGFFKHEISMRMNLDQ